MTGLLEEKDILFAHKAINIMPGLSANARRVAGAIIDHFNRKTGQCDPSVKRLMALLGIGRSTVLRATTELCGDENRLFNKSSHGGNSHRAAYQPNWNIFRKIVGDWEDRMRSSGGKKRHSKVSKVRRSRYQNCDLDGLKSGTLKVSKLGPEPIEETNPINQSKKPIQESSSSATVIEAPRAKQQSPAQTERQQGLWKRSEGSADPQFLLPITGGKAASHENGKRITAEKKLFADIQRLGEETSARTIIEMSDDQYVLAVRAEMSKTGSGLRTLLAALAGEQVAQYG